MRGTRARGWVRGVTRSLAAPALAALLLPAAPALAMAAGPTISVQSTADDAGSAAACTVVSGTQVSCPSLRDAVNFADGLGTSAGTPTITVPASQQPYTLTDPSGALLITAPMNIVGAGPQATVIKQTVADSVIRDTITPSGQAPSSIANLTVEGGRATASAGAPAQGGGIDDPAGAALNLTDVAVIDNSVTGAPGGAGAGGDAFGAGIAENPGGSGSQVSIYNGVDVINNTATGGAGATGGGSAYGGGIDAPGALIENSTVAGNFASGGANSTGAGGGADGGGVYQAEVVNSIISNNTATAAPGGVAAGGGWASGPADDVGVFNSTIFANTVSDPSAQPSGGGGGVAVSAGEALYNDTLAGNTATGAMGGNLAVEPGSPSSATIADTIIAGGSAPAGAANCYQPAGTLLIDAGHNLEQSLISQSQCGFTPGAQDVFGDPMLPGSATENGGPTQTLAPSPFSPVIGAGGTCTALSGVLAALSLPFTDQRGLPRKSPCEIGAFETQPPLDTVAPSIIGTAAVGSQLACSPGTWSGDGPLSFAYRWLRQGALIAGAASASYTPATGDAGTQLSCEVIATGTYASTTATSPGVTVAAPAPSAPVLRSFAESNRRWRERARPRHGPPVGTTFSFLLDQPASVTLTFTALLPGRLGPHHTCLPQTAHNAYAKRCTRTKTMGGLLQTAVSGSNRISFNGRRPRLPPGSYTVQIQAKNAAGQASAPQSLAFTILP